MTIWPNKVLMLINCGVGITDGLNDAKSYSISRLYMDMLTSKQVFLLTKQDKL